MGRASDPRRLRPDRGRRTTARQSVVGPDRSPHRVRLGQRSIVTAERARGASSLARVEVILANPELYALADAVPNTDPTAGGRPRDYPPVMRGAVRSADLGLRIGSAGRGGDLAPGGVAHDPGRAAAARRSGGRHEADAATPLSLLPEHVPDRSRRAGPSRPDPPGLRRRPSARGRASSTRTARARGPTRTSLG